MTDASDLIAQMIQAIERLYQKLCASEARNVDLEAQSTTLLKAKTAECGGHAQRCRVAERTAEHTGLEATRRLREEHTKQGGALWMRYTQAVGEAGRARSPARLSRSSRRSTEASVVRAIHNTFIISPSQSVHNPQAERDALQERFEGEWRRFGGRAGQHVASLRGMMKGQVMRGWRPHASHRVVRGPSADS